jgi:hypothetical protein
MPASTHHEYVALLFECSFSSLLSWFHFLEDLFEASNMGQVRMDAPPHSTEQSYAVAFRLHQLFRLNCFFCLLPLLQVVDQICALGVLAHNKGYHGPALVISGGAVQVASPQGRVSSEPPPQVDLFAAKSPNASPVAPAVPARPAAAASPAPSPSPPAAASGGAKFCGGWQELHCTALLQCDLCLNEVDSLRCLTLLLCAMVCCVIRLCMRSGNPRSDPASKFCANWYDCHTTPWPNWQRQQQPSTL